MGAGDWGAPVWMGVGAWRGLNGPPLKFKIRPASTTANVVRATSPDPR